MRILAIVGTRPEAIKMTPVIQELRARPGDIETFVCSTGQHREMLNQVFELFHIRPDFELNLMEYDQTPSQVAAGVMAAVDPLLADLKPDWVLVQGDTTTVMAASIAAFHRKVRIGHVEAGLRTYDRDNPFPEEMNRVVTDHVCDKHFAPTAAAKANLLREGISPEGIYITGNTVIDALLWTASQPVSPAVEAELKSYHLSERVRPGAQSLILVTAHRRENHGEPLAQICQALRRIAETRPDLHIVYPVHRNPNVWEPVHARLSGIPGITLTPPVGYPTLVQLMKHSKLVLTDSGGIQEEAPSLGVPVIVLRKTTERPEAVKAGIVKMGGTDAKNLLSLVDELLDRPEVYERMAQAINPYGDGQAARRTADALILGCCDEFNYKA